MDLRSRNYGQALRVIREKSFPVARDAAARAGFSASYLSEVETGKRPLTAGMVKKMAEVFGVTPKALAEQLQTEMDRLPEPDDLADLQKAMVTSPRLHEDGGLFRVKMKPDTQAADALLRHLVANMSREQRFTLLREFTTAAEAGDSEALAKARVLLDLIPMDSTASG